MERKEITGGWLVLRDPKQVPERLRRPLIAMTARTIGALENPQENQAEAIDFFNEFNDALALAMISEWSFGNISKETLLDLPAKAYDEIREIVAPFVSELMPDFSASDDPKATTAN